MYVQTIRCWAGPHKHPPHRPSLVAIEVRSEKGPRLIKKYQPGEDYKAYGLIWAKTVIGGCFIREINQGYVGMIEKIDSS